MRSAPSGPGTALNFGTYHNNANVVTKNNIVDGSGARAEGFVCEYNIYTSLAGGQGLNATEFQDTAANLFVDPASFDYHLNAGASAINAGVDVGFTTDKDGQAISGNPDIGAYERP